MPSVNVFLPQEHLAQHAPAIPDFVADVTELCIGVIGASLDKVQVILVPTLPVLQGPPGSIEVKLRAGRSAETMDRFMAGLDNASQARFGCRPRIRCFASEAEALFARN